MSDTLNLEKTPEFVSCRYCQDGGEAHCIVSDAENDMIIFLVREQLFFGTQKLVAGRYMILRAGDTVILRGDFPEYFLIYFRGIYTLPGQNIPISGKFDYKNSVKHFNRLLEIRDKLLDGQTVSVIEQEALFCNILSELYSIESMSGGEYLAKSIMQDIIDGYASDITLEKLSEKYFYSRNYIIRVFRKKYHVTPYRHIIHLRIEKAKQLLSSTDKPCQEIAEICGYHDMSTFYKAFVCETGESPERWRNHSVSISESDYRSEIHAIKGGE